jgi:hypothetical protein
MQRILSHMEHLRSRLSSTSLILFYLSSLIVSGIKIKSILIRDLWDPVFGWVLPAQAGLLLVMIILEVIEKPKAYYISLDEDPNPCPEGNANIFSRVVFHWMNPLMKLGYSKNLEMDDLWNLNKSESASYNSDIFQATWEAENRKKKYEFLLVDNHLVLHLC